MQSLKVEAKQLETERTMDNLYNQKDDQQETAPVQPFKGPTFVSVQVTLEQQYQRSAEDSLESYQTYLPETQSDAFAC